MVPMPHYSNRVLQVCLRCGKSFSACHWSVVHGKAKFCCWNCFCDHRYGANLEERFWRHVEISPGCWLWTGGTANGYGLMREKGQHVYAHRFSFELHFTSIPTGLQVHHDCPAGDNPACVKPDHLWLGTQDENVQDCIAKGRKPPGYYLEHPEAILRGTSHPAAKLDEKAVLTIRSEAADGVRPVRLAERFGVSDSMIYRIIKRLAWT